LEQSGATGNGRAALRSDESSDVRSPSARCVLESRAGFARAPIFLKGDRGEPKERLALFRGVG